MTADSSKKRLPESNGFNCEGFSSKFKRSTKPCAVRDFPKNCGPWKPNIGTHSLVQCSSEVESSSSNYSEESGPLASRTNGGRTKGFNDLENPKILDDGEAVINQNEQKLGSLGKVWEFALGKVAEVTALARKKALTEAMETGDEWVLAKDFSVRVDEKYLDKKVSDSDRESSTGMKLRRVQGKDNNGSELEWKDVGNDVYVLSPQVVMVESHAKFDVDGGGLVRSQETVSIFSEGDSDGGISFSDKNGKKCGENWPEPEFLCLDQSEVKELDESTDNLCLDQSEVKELDESTDNLTTSDDLAYVKFKDTCNDEPKSCQIQDELVNLDIVKRDQPGGYKVREALLKFEEHFRALEKERKERKVGMGKGQDGRKYSHIEAWQRIKADGMFISVWKPFGHIPGIEIGDTFQFRSQLAVVGLHRQMMCGIDYVTIEDKKFATCVVDSGRYENEARTNDSLIYSGQGGNPKLVEKAADQKFERGNRAMVHSMEMRYPVRFIRKRKNRMTSKVSEHSYDAKHVYIYDGLYMVTRYWRERDENRSLVFKFELNRLSDQPRPRHTVAKSEKLFSRKEICIIGDISTGKENRPIRAMNGIDDLRPPPFTYINKIIYPDRHSCVEPVGCDCINGCSDCHRCPCVVRNGGEIPFNEKGLILRSRPMVYECGPNCKCPPSCKNRVSQHGPRFQLEIFKTKERGWGLRTRDYVTSGSFISEYIGKLLREKEAEQRIGEDEYLFDIGDDHDEDAEFKSIVGSRNREVFAIDAGKFGNVARFINHSCSPNMYAQEVLYDHGDEKMPHIMFFATRNIPALHELTYDYNYKMDRVCDANGNIKNKQCFCGSRNCNGRMF